MPKAELETKGIGQEYRRKSLIDGRPIHINGGTRGRTKLQVASEIPV